MSALEILQTTLYKLCAEFFETEISTEDIVFSTHSIFIAFMMIYIGSKENTKKQLEKVFGFDRVDVLETYKVISHMNTKENETSKCNIFNSVWMQQNVLLKDNYLETLQQLEATIYKADFAGNFEGVRKEINEVVREKTGNLILDMLAPGSVSRETISVLVNTIYFRGQWETEFNTVDIDFEKVGTVSGISVEKALQCVTTNDETTLRIPYDNNYSMIIVMPNNMTNFVKNKKHNKLHTYVNDLCYSFKEKTILKMPKFSINWGGSISKNLQTLGITDAFDAHANFSGITDVPIYVSDVIHKAKIRVDEKGTVAAASTAILMNKRMAIDREQRRVIINKPFFFILVDSKSLPLFFGKCTHPHFDKE
ncbi:serine protease inhibitor, serpin, putative [Entamoeba invadens IP1]|uniref:Serine protease inhibitor, serpin, putative n=1 Tax=Entamoeba invadens TaxID=33085 RepID=S0B033_ENTIV|nr:serine protease inhibitor, serpin, putative [Entamoeba invadens IP1]ELP85225.1 serine protease inhibitor, serpin, putative [Entamoeba invadens IP1]BAN40529.1 serine protease inhibitor, serpin, putative [Entamoeba invadens]|eukprot:XP_004184571.1 serine protease inhibitor, serpin, putative [Entamoeba invadens IP1]